MSMGRGGTNGLAYVGLTERDDRIRDSSETLVFGLSSPWLRRTLGPIPF